MAPPPDRDGPSGDPVAVRILLVADTHIGFDWPRRPRIERRRRGPDFLANLERALAPARSGEVDLVVHGGDVLDRSRVPAPLVEAALAPLADVAERGVPVCVVPGNHERATLPRTLSTARPNLHFFWQPRTVALTLRGVRVAVAGFPYVRDVRQDFGGVLAATGHEDVAAGIKVLCMHQVVEGARVGPADYTFRAGPHVLPGRALPRGFAAVLSGHIHRAQLLTRDLSGRRLAAPVIYPGSVERTAFAEANEVKGYAVLAVAADGTPGGRLVDLRFPSLPARPMFTIDLDDVAERGAAAGDLAAVLRDRLAALPPDAVVRVRAPEALVAAEPGLFSSARLRAMAPPTANIELAVRPAARSAGLSVGDTG